MQPECAVLPMIVESAFDDRSTTLTAAVQPKQEPRPAAASLTAATATEKVRLVLAELLGARRGDGTKEPAR